MPVISVSWEAETGRLLSLRPARAIQQNPVLKQKQKKGRDLLGDRLLAQHAQVHSPVQLTKQNKKPHLLLILLSMWYIHTKGYHSALKLNEVLTHASTQINLEDGTLNELSTLNSKNLLEGGRKRELLFNEEKVLEIECTTM